MTLPTPAPGVPDNRGSRLFGFGRAHAKAILLGEHAVVYGAPALAIPVPQLTVTASAAQSARTPGRDGGISFAMTGSASGPVVMQATDGLRRLVAEFRETTGVTEGPHLDVLLDCAVPPGRGLGSSAACARAVVLALADLFGRDLDARTVFDLVQTAENVAHGTASGVDALATGAPSALLFTAGTAEEPDIGFDGVCVVADSGTAGRTKDAVALLRRAFERRPGARDEFVRRVTRLTRAAVRDLAAGRAEGLGTRLTACHALLADAGLSTPRIDALVDAALAAGSPGAKISGGGLGGCMIALAENADLAPGIEERLRAAGAVRTWAVPLGRTGRDDR